MKKPRIAEMCPDSISKIFYLFVLAVVFSTAIFVCPAQAVNYWVSNAGNDANIGTTPATAFKSLQRGANAATASGDVINVMDGTYSYWDNQPLCDAARAITGDNYMAVCMLFYSGVTLKAQNRGMAKIIGSLESFGGAVCAGIEIWGGAPLNQGKNITIDGFEIDGRDAGMVRRLQDGICLNTSAQNNIIQYNKVHHCSRNGISIGKTVGGGFDQDSHGRCDNSTVTNNESYDNSVVGIYSYATVGTNLYKNICYNNQSGIRFYAKGYRGGGGHGANVARCYVRYNICYNNTKNGFESYYKNENGPPNAFGGVLPADIVIEHCTFANNPKGIESLASYVVVTHTIIANSSIIGIDANPSWGANEYRIYCGHEGNNNGYSVWMPAYCNTSNNNGQGAFNDAAGRFVIDNTWFSEQIDIDPQFLATATGVWATAYELKNKYTPARVDTGQVVTSPCIDHGGEGEVAPDLISDIGAHRNSSFSTNYIGYPDPPSNLGGYISGSWYNTRYANLSFNLKDPVVPASAENVRFRYQMKYESADFSAPTFDYTDIVWKTSPYPVAVSTTTSSIMANCSEGQYRWRVYTQDYVTNVSTWSVANAGAIAFGVDITTPTVINDLFGTTTMGASSATLTWSDVDDSPPKTVPYTLSRVSKVETYNIYRSTISFFTSGLSEDDFKAMVIAAGIATNQQSTMIVEPRGAGLAGTPHTPYIDGLVVGDDLLTTQTYYYYVNSLDYAGNESILGNEVIINPGNPGGGGDLEYIYDPAMDKPCYGAALPTPNELYLEVVAGTSLSMATPNDQTMSISNDLSVRHYARIKKVPPVGVFTECIRFYYTVGTFSTAVNTNVDVGPDNLCFDGIEYDDNIDGYKYFYADFPSDIHACGDSPWNAGTPYGVVGVRVSGCQADKDPALDANWITADDDNSYTYYVRKIAGCDASHPGELNNDVRTEAMKHDWNADLANSPPDVRKYFMPDGTATVDQARCLAANHSTDPTIGDGRPDIFLDEIPELFLRFAYGDGDGGNNNYEMTYRCQNGPTGSINWTNVSWPSVNISSSSVIDNAADNSFAVGYSTPSGFYGHYGMLRFSNIAVLRTIPESAAVEYYFKIKDGNKDVFCYAGAGGVALNQGTARGTPFIYDILQDDLSRPQVYNYTAGPMVPGPQNRQGSTIAWADGDGEWSRGGTYSVRVALQDLKSGGSDIYGITGFNNVISGRSGDSGIRTDITATGTIANPVHDTRVYYRFSSTALTGHSATYGGDSNYSNLGDAAAENITAQECGDAANNFDGFVTLRAVAGTLDAWGNGLYEGSFTLGATNQFIYYRIYACNNDFDPQAFVTASTNTFTSVGAPAPNGAHLATGAAVAGLPTDPANRELDRDHGWVTPTRYGGSISGARFIRITSEADFNGTKKVVITDVSTEDDRVGNIISHEIRNPLP